MLKRLSLALAALLLVTTAAAQSPTFDSGRIKGALIFGTTPKTAGLMAATDSSGNLLVVLPTGGAITVNDNALITAAAVAANYAPLASPALTGIPTTPTAAIDTSTNQIASTAFATAGRSVGAGKLVGNPATASAPSTDVTPGDTLSGGLYLDPVSGRLTATAPTTYYLTKVPDASAIAGYYTAQRNLSALANQTTTVALTGTTLTTVASFVTPPGDPRANAFAPGTFTHYVYVGVDDASAQFTVSVRALARNVVTGAEVNLGTATTATLTGYAPNVPIGTWVTFRKQSAQAMGVSDRLVFRVMATRVGGPATINLTLYTDGSGARSTVSTTISGSGQIGPDYEVNVVDLGAVGDAKAAADGVITAGQSQLCSATAGFVAADVGKSIEVNDMLGIGLTPFAGTIASVDSATCVTVSGTATASTAGVRYLQSASAEIAGATGNYVPNDVLTLAGGSFDTPAQATVVSTRVRPDGDTYRALTIVNAGSGGVAGTVVLRGTTGTGTKFTARGTVAGGVLVDVSLFNGGVYTANPSNFSNEPVTSDQALAGVVLAIGGMDVGVLSVTTAGSYSVIPADPIDTGAGSISGATGATIDGNWQAAGRFVWFSNDRQAFADAITRVNNLVLAGGRAVIKVPGRNYGISGAALPIATQPVQIVGDGRDQTQIIVGQGYAGPHVFGWSNLFPSGVSEPVGGPTSMFSGSGGGAGATGITVTGNRMASAIPDAFVLYDRNAAMYFNNIGGSNIGSLVRSGVLSSTNVAFLRESYINDYRCTNCGIGSLTASAVRPVMWFHAVGVAAKTNNLQVNGGNIVFPLGPGMAFTTQATAINSGSKQIEVIGLRIERAPGTSGAALGDLLQFGSPADTDSISQVNLTNVRLLSPQSGGNAIGFYGTRASARPNAIKITDLAVSGQSLGQGINIQAGQNLVFGIKNLAARAGQIVTGNHTDNRLLTTVASGSSASAVVLSAGSGVADAYVGGALAVTVPASFTASIAANGTMTVTAVASGRLMVGSIITGGGIKPVQAIAAFGTGTGGTGTYTVSNPQTLGSRTLAGKYVEVRNVTAWNGGTKTATVGALQGSAASFGFVPQSGDTAAVDSLVNGALLFDDAGAGKLYDWSGVGLNVAGLITMPIYPAGVPTGTQTLAARLNLQAGVQLGAGTVPSAATDACAAGAISYDGSYLYLCTAANTWKRTAVATWP